MCRPLIVSSLPAYKEEKDLKKLYNLLSEKQVKRLGLLPKAGESNDDNLTRPYVVSSLPAQPHHFHLMDKHFEQPA